jgi:dTMP kinase
MKTIIAFEGIDGSGKSTQLDLLDVHLRMQKKTVRTVKPVTRDSGFFRRLEALVDEIPRNSFCDVVAFERHCRILEATSSGETDADVLLFDRYLFSDIAYAKAYECPTAFIERLADCTPTPDIVVLCDAPVEVAMRRISRRKDILHFQENYSILQRARTAFFEACTMAPKVLIADSWHQSAVATAKQVTDFLSTAQPGGI